VVVTGTLRGGPLARGDSLRLLPGDGRMVRIREIQTHGVTVPLVERGGRTALNLVGVDVTELHRGMVLTADPGVIATDRVLAAFDDVAADRTRGRIHVGTAAVDAAIGRAGREAVTLPDGRTAGIVRLSEKVALRAGDRFVLRRGAPVLPVGGVVLDPAPPRGASRRRQTRERVAALAQGEPSARLELHGILDGVLATDLIAAAEEAAIAAVGSGSSLPAVRTAVALTLRRSVSVRRDPALAAAGSIIDHLVEEGRLQRDGDVVRLPGVSAAVPDPMLAAAMDRLESLLAVPAPPPLAEAAGVAGCPPAGVRELERAGRIVVLEPDLAYAAPTYRDLAAHALDLAAQAPLTPAAFRDATGTSRKYVMAILEDLDRRAILRRTPDGHVPGPKAPAVIAR
jgi:selenocysteine-specific elongation factor